MQLISVVLPEPFGPMRPKRSPGRTSRLTPDERREAAEALDDAVDREQRLGHHRAPAREPLHEPRMPSRRQHHEGDQQHAHDQHVELRGDRHGDDLLHVPSSTAPITGPSQLAVPPMIGIASAETA